MSVTPSALRRLMKEISELQRSPPEGIRIQTSEENMLDVTGVIEGPEGTPYAGGYFRVKFKFTEEFPAAPPKCWFATKIFHPNVSGAGEICVNTLKKDWKSTYGIGHILVTVKCLLIYPNPESALDEEAGKLLLENYKSYCDRAKLITGVHARGRPAEFDIPSASTSQTTKPSSSGSSTVSSSTSTTTSTSRATPVTSPEPSLPSSPIVNIPVVTAHKSATSRAHLKHATPPNLEKDTSAAPKERQHSPAPLSTADANVGAKPLPIGLGTPDAPALASKAPKRAATGGAYNGAEKRKKALKRL